jgi:hypothetical protein
MLKAGRAFHAAKAKKNNFPKTRGVAMNPFVLSSLSILYLLYWILTFVSRPLALITRQSTIHCYFRNCPPSTSSLPTFLRLSRVSLLTFRLLLVSAG